MRHGSSFFQGHDGLSLYEQWWLPEAPQGYLLIVHGLGEHSGRYANVVQTALSLGIGCYAFDHRGHGRSEGRRGHVDHFEEYVEDLDQMVERTLERAGNHPLFLLGHSMGGVIALAYLLRAGDRVHGAVISAPGLRARVRVPTWKRTMAVVLSRIAPRVTLPSGLPADGLSHDPEVVRAYVEDPLVHDRVSARWYIEFLRVGEMVMASAERFTTPVLFIQGSEDPLVDPGATAAFYQRAASQDKALRLYPGLFHECFNELDNTGPLEDLRTWLTRRL